MVTAGGGGAAAWARGPPEAWFLSFGRWEDKRTAMAYAKDFQDPRVVGDLLHLWPGDGDTLEFRGLVLRTIAPASINKLGSTVLGSGGAICIRYTKMSLLSSLPRANPPKRPFTTTRMLPGGVTNKAWCSHLGQGSHSLSCACPASGQSSGLGVVSPGITCGAGAAS